MTALVNSVKTGLGVSLALALVIVGAILVWGDVSAHDYSPPERWDTSITPNTTSVDTRYAWAIRSAARDYNSNTDLMVIYCASSCNNSNIRHYENEYGMSKWAARTRYVLLSGGLIRNATIQWNAEHGPFSRNDANHIARHEMGHSFGFDHFPCSGPDYAWSVMLYGCTNGFPGALTSHDKRDVNNKY